MTDRDFASSRYWDEVARKPDGLPEGWRRHSRAAHLAFVGRAAPHRKGRWLKTDLQEETSATRALITELPGAWTGIDLSPEVASRARGAAAVAGDVLRLPFAAAAFDGVLSTSTLDHFADAQDLQRALAELRRVIAPGGVVLLTLDNPTNPLIRLRNALPRRVQRASTLVPFHVGATLSDRDGRAALSRAGFTVSRVEYLLHAPHIIGTRLARFRWFERRMLPLFDKLASTWLARYTAHFVAFVASAPS